MVKSRSVKRNAKNARGLGRDRAAVPKTRASYFRFARFNTSALYYLRAWHRLWRASHNIWKTNGKPGSGLAMEPEAVDRILRQSVELYQPIP